MIDVTAVSYLRETNKWTEDGDRLVVADWHVTATAASGRRFMLRHSFHGAVFVSEEGFAFSGQVTDRENEAKATALAAKIQAAFDAGRKINPEHWDEIEPCYGSEAWIAADAGGFFAWEEKRREMEGY